MRILLLVCLLSGCATSARFQDPPLSADRIATIHSATEGRIATLVRFDGTRTDASALQVRPDSTSWMDLDGLRQAVSTPDLYLIRLDSDDRASVGETAMLGAMVGALAAFGLAGTGASDPAGFGGDPRPLAAIPGALLGGLVGLAIGVGSDRGTTFVVNRRPPAR